MPSTTSIFDRLAHQGTAASKAREAEEKKLRDEIEKRHAAASAATKPKALHVKVPPPQDVGGTSPIKSPKLTPQQQAAFFDRLAKQETVSSAAHHHSNIIPNGSVGGPSPQHKSSPRNHLHHHGEGDDAHQSVYNRLYKQETASSKAHHMAAKDDAATKLPPRPLVSPRNNTTTNISATTASPPPSLLQRSPPTHPPIPITMNLYIRTHSQKQQQQQHDGKGDNTIQFTTLEVASKRVRKQINLHQMGKVSASSLSHDIITKLFTMDFQPTDTATSHHHHHHQVAPPDTDTTTTTATSTTHNSNDTTTAASSGHWQIGTAIVEELDPIADKSFLLHLQNHHTHEEQTSPDNNMKCFWAEKEAIHDHHEIYSVAKAKAIIAICAGRSTSSMYVDEYQYTVIRREK